MNLTLYIHPLASYCHKALTALYENGTAFSPVIVDLADEKSTSALLALWPVGKIPVLHDATRQRTVPETTIIIEYLERHYPGATPLLPEDADGQLEARLWDRFFDLYVSTPMQKLVLDRIRPAGKGDPQGVADAHGTLDTAYEMIERQLDKRQWAAGEAFTIADCSAAPALFFASIIHPFAPHQGNLRAYLDRLLERPSFRRAIREAQPYFDMFPYREAMPERYLCL